MTPEKRQQIETQIQNDFAVLQKNLEDLKNEVQSETDESKKQEKIREIQGLERELSEIKTKINTLNSLQKEDLQLLKTKLESTKKTYQHFRWEATELQNEKLATPKTYELLKNSETYNRLLNIISSNSKEFAKLPWETAEKKLEYIFEKIRTSIVLFMKNKLWNSEKYNDVINNTIAPAFEWSLLELLRDNGNEANISMLRRMDNISFDSFKKLLSWVWNFAKKATWSYNKFSQWMNAVDYLSVHNWVLYNPNKSEVLSNPLKFKEYMNDSRFVARGFSPYTAIPDNIFKINENQTFGFGMSLLDKQSVLTQIWNIQVVNNPKTASLIVGMLDKPAELFNATSGLQATANGLLDWIDSLSSVTKMFGVDILWEFTKSWEKSLAFRVLDFVCKLIWITWGLEWIVKKWRMDRMNLTDGKNENISQIFKEFKGVAGNNISISVSWPESCNSALNNFVVTDLNNQSTTMWDHLRDSIAEKMDASLISPVIVQQAIDKNILSWKKEDYLKEEIDWNLWKKIVVNPDKFTPDDKKSLSHFHLINMKSHLEKYNESDLSDFYTNIHSTEDIALCIIASLYVNKNDVIEWVKAKVFLPENYGAVRSNGSVVESWWRENLDSVEFSDKQKVSEQWMYDKIVEYWITDTRQIAYVLATVKWETNPSGVWFRNIEEIWKWKEKEYWKIDPETKKAYYGRWFVQLTWKKNYEKYTNIIRERGKDFKDNDGGIIKCSDIDLVKDPDLILKSNELAAFILVHWMKNWTFTWRKLDDFIKDWKTNYIAARGVVNWSDRAKEFANYANTYLNKITNDNSLA